MKISDFIYEVDQSSVFELKFSQLHIYDTKNELDNRMKCFDGLDRCLIGQLQEMMH